MSKLFSWFKKDKPKQDSASISPQLKIEDSDAVKAENIEEKASRIDSSTQSTNDTIDVPDAKIDDAHVSEVFCDTSQAVKLSTDDEGSQDEAPKQLDSSDIIDVTSTPNKIDTGMAPENSTTEAEFTASINDIPAPSSPPESELEIPVKDDISESAVVDATTEPATQVSLFARLKASLSRTKNNIGSGFSSLLLGKSIDADLYEELETQLLLADVGMNTTNKIIAELTKNAKSSSLKDGEALSAMLQLQMQTILDKVETPIDFDIARNEEGKKHPFVILMVGVNGVGKTTTIGKLAKQFQAQGKSVMLAAGDTFRAAAVEQLQVWGERNHIPVVAQHTGADSASVIFDAIESATAKNVDVLIADTAGRLQNKDHLIEELKKVVRVMKKLNVHAPHEVMLTLDASTGQNAVSQTKIFNEAVGITGINLTKLDGTAKGGVIFALADQFNIPVRYIGIGEDIDDLREFDAKAFVDALFS